MQVFIVNLVRNLLNLLIVFTVYLVSEHVNKTVDLCLMLSKHVMHLRQSIKKYSLIFWYGEKQAFTLQKIQREFCNCLGKFT